MTQDQDPLPIIRHTQVAQPDVPDWNRKLGAISSHTREVKLAEESCLLLGLVGFAGDGVRLPED
jgi:hypothetical protein